MCKLNKEIYSLKHALHASFDRLRTILVQLGFTISKEDASQLVKVTTSLVIYVLVYVNDIIFIGSNPSKIHILISTLNKAFPLKGLGNLNYFMGIDAQRLSSSELFLSQNKYMYELLDKVGMNEVKAAITQMFSNVKLYSFKALRPPNWCVVKRILRYLHGTLDYRIHFRYSTKLLVNTFVDAYWGSCLDEKIPPLVFMFSWELIRSVGQQRNNMLFLGKY